MNENKSGGKAKGGIGIGGVILAVIIYFVARGIGSNVASSRNTADDVPEQTQTETRTDADTEDNGPVFDIMTQTKYFLREETEDAWIIEEVTYGDESKKLQRIDVLIGFSTDVYDADAIRSAAPSEWDDYVPGFSTYSFASKQITESDRYITVKITLNDLDEAQNLRALNAGGYLTWEGGDTEYADADSYMDSLRSVGAQELGGFLPAKYS